MTGAMKNDEHSAGSVLGLRALNRALLARQFLIQRAKLPVRDAIRHLAGLQAQAPNPPYFGLWTRLDQFNPEDLSQLMIDRHVVRIALMRSTIHLVTAEDCLDWRPVLQPVLDRSLQGAFGRSLADYGQLAAKGRALIEEQPVALSELGQLLQAQWPDRDPKSLANAVRTVVPIVQVPPRGLWGTGGQAVHTSAEAWLGKPLSLEGSPEDMILRYLAAFGPATVKDMQVWSGLTRLREVTERLRPVLCSFRDERGNELFDLPNAPRPDVETTVPPRFLGEFDNILLSYDDRTRIIADAHKPLVFTGNGIVRSTILINGFVAGTWKIERHRHTAALVIAPFEPLRQKDRLALEEEGTQLLDFAAADSSARYIRFIDLH